MTTVQTDTHDAAGEIRTVSFVSLGCPKNLVDSEKMLGLLAEQGLTPVSAGETGAGVGEPGDLSLSGSEQDDSAAVTIDPADAVVVNTCGFLEASKRESLAVIEEAIRAKQRGEVKRVVVAGCLVQRHRAKLLEWAPGIDAMVGVFDRDRIVEAVRGAADAAALRERNAPGGEASPRYWIHANALTKLREVGAGGAETSGRGAPAVGLTVNGKDGRGVGYFESDAARLRLTPRHYAYLRISEGCNQKCAFCTIPSIRGKMRSKGAEAIVAEARELVRDGAFELLLIGQDTTSYGDDIGVGLDPAATDPFAAGLPRLLRSISDAVGEEAGRGWVRLMYAYPTTFTEPIIDAFAELVDRGRLLPYLDIPLQHASDRMLTAMRRNVTAHTQRRLIETLRERIPGMAVRTTFITGFPGETDDDHAELLDFIEDVGFDAVGVFRYSREPNTPAGTMDEDPSLHVPDAVKRERQAEIMALQQSLAFEQAAFLAEQFDPGSPLDTGCRFDVLIDRPRGETDAGTHVAEGRTYFQAPQIDATTLVESREPLAPGELVPCVVVGSEGYDLIARPVTELEKRVSLSVL